MLASREVSRVGRKGHESTSRLIWSVWHLGTVGVSGKMKMERGWLDSYGQEHEYASNAGPPVTSCAILLFWRQKKFWGHGACMVLIHSLVIGVKLW